MAYHPVGQTRVHCSFAKAKLIHTCPYYKPSHYGIECRAFKPASTTFGNLTIFHCIHDPPKGEQTWLPLTD
jgi:hypothetical protein